MESEDVRTTSCDGLNIFEGVVVTVVRVPIVSYPDYQGHRRRIQFSVKGFVERGVS